MPKVPLNVYQTPSEKGNVQTGTSKAKTAKAYINATRDVDDPDETATNTGDLHSWARSVLSEAGADLDSVRLDRETEER